jgi:hypothetical protein
LTGLEIDGAGAAYNGIVFNSGSSLTVSNCIVKDFSYGGNPNTGNGILIEPASGMTFTIVNTVTVNNGFSGVAYYPTSGSPTAIGAVDHLVANGNFQGFGTSLSNTSGGTAAISISNTVMSNNSSFGIQVSSTGVTLTLDNDQISNNSEGITTTGTTVLSRSVITENSQYGISNNGTVYTYGDNRIYLNGNSNAIGGNALAAVSAE